LMLAESDLSDRSKPGSNRALITSTTRRDGLIWPGFPERLVALRETGPNPLRRSASV
jgi:hypothetical protein